MISWYRVLAIILKLTQPEKVDIFKNISYLDGSKITISELQENLNNGLITLLKSDNGNVFVCHGTEDGRLYIQGKKYLPDDTRVLSAIPKGFSYGIACYPGTRQSVANWTHYIVWSRMTSKVPLVIVTIGNDLYVYDIPKNIQEALKLPEAK